MPRAPRDLELEKLIRVKAEENQFVRSNNSYYASDGDPSIDSNTEDYGLTFYYAKDLQDLKNHFKQKIGRDPTAEELTKIKLYLSNEERSPDDPTVREQAVDYLIKNWGIRPQAPRFRSCLATCEAEDGTLICCHISQPLKERPIECRGYDNPQLEGPF